MPEEEEEEEDTAAAAEEEGKDVRTNMNAGAEQGAVHEPGQKDGAKDGTKDTEGLLTQKAEKDGEAREREGRAAEALVEDTAEAHVLEAESLLCRSYKSWINIKISLREKVIKE